MAKRTQAFDAEPGTAQAVDHIWEDIEALEAKIARLEERELEPPSPESEPSSPEPEGIEKVTDINWTFNGTVSMVSTLDVSGAVTIGGALTVTGLTSLDGTLRLPHGTGAAPAIDLFDDGGTGDTNPLGFYRIGESNLALNISGEQSHLFAGDGNSYFYLMSDRTGDAGNDWEALRFRKAPAGDAIISVTSGATGTNRDLYIQTDGTNDIILRTAGTNNRLVIDASAGGVTQVVNGAKATPGYGFINDVDTGLFLQAAGSMRVTTGGVDRGEIAGEQGAMDAYKTSSQSITNVTWTTITSWDGELCDFDSAMNTTNGVYTPTAEPGLFVLSFWCTFANNATGERILRILKDTTTEVAYDRRSAHGNVVMGVAAVIYLNYPSYSGFRPQVWQSSGGALNVTLARFGAKRLSHGSTKT